jgi:large subunit ribosomal protein L15
MKLHELQPAPGSRTPRTRVGRGIAAGKGKTAGRGTKGQKARAGGSIPPWFEGGQTPLHMRIPKLRGFKNRFKIYYEVVNVGAIGDLAERGAFQVEGGGKSSKAAPITINQDILRAVGLVRTLDKPLKILGAGELSAPLFVVADAFTASARAKIEAAGGTVNVLEVPTSPSAALGVDDQASVEPAPGKTGRAPKAKAAEGAKADEQPVATASATQADSDAEADTEPVAEAEPTKPARRSQGKASAASETTDAAATGSATADELTAEPEDATAATTADDDEPSATGEAEPAPGDDA